MKVDFLKLSEALKLMKRVDNEGELIPFNCSVRTFNRNSKKGGTLLNIKQCILLPLSFGDSKKNNSVQSLGFKSNAQRNPNHFEHKTRNLKLPNGNTKKININFLISVNNIPVIY